MYLKIDGSHGEGGGQILRTGLSLSCTLTKPIQIYNIRKGRPKPGMKSQHLTCVKALNKLVDAKVEGSRLNSENLEFTPHQIRSGEFVFDVAEKRASAGSASLVLQALLPVLLQAPTESKVTICGGTHVSWSPPYHYLEKVFIPTLSKFGIEPKVWLERWGFYPKGGGRLLLRVKPCVRLSPIQLTEPGPLKKITGISAVSNLPISIAQRQRDEAIRILKPRGLAPNIELLEVPSRDKGTFFFLLTEFENTVGGFSSLGAIKKRAETVGFEAARGLLDFLDSGCAIDPYLADQIIPYTALAKGDSRFTTSKITRHLLTNVWVVEQFLPTRFQIDGQEGQKGKVICYPK